MASEKLLVALNDQYNFELISAHAYMSMAAYCSDKNMNGFSHFFIEQAKEEYTHAMMFYDFIFDMDGSVKQSAFPQPENEFESFLAVFKEALNHEKLVTSKIHNLVTLADEEKAYETKEFLQWFIAEQREEENTMKDIIFKLEMIKDNYQGLFMLDNELGQRPVVSVADAGNTEG